MAFISAQWERPHLSRLKDTYTVTTFHCVSRTFKREIKLKYFSIRQATYLGTHLLPILNHCIYKMDYVMWEPGKAHDQVCQTRGALPTLQTHHRAHWEAETVTLLKCYPTSPLPLSGAPTSAVQLSSPAPVNPNRAGRFSFCCQRGHQQGLGPWSHTQSVNTDSDMSRDIATSRLLQKGNL